MTTTGSIEGRDITARDIVTGLKIENVQIVLNSLDELAALLGDEANPRFRLETDGSLAALVEGRPRLSLPADLLEAFKQLPRAADLPPAERHRAYAAWLVTRRPVAHLVQQVAARDYYVELHGHLSWDWEDDPLELQLSWLHQVGEGPERRFERRQLDNVEAGVSQFPAFVLLGPPGSGKSTVLERLIYTTARDYLRGKSRRLPLGVTLADYRWQQQRPLEFIQAKWQANVSGNFVELARSGQVLLLIDGLNEMPRLNHSDERAGRAAAWKRFIDEHFADESPHSGRLVLASRDADDYEHRLGLPRVEIDHLTPAQIERFAEAYLAGDTAPFLAELGHLELDEQAQNPFALFILTQLYRQGGGQLPANRGRMFAQYAAGLLSIHYRFRPREQQAALQALAELGYALQERGEGTVLSANELVGLLPAEVSLPREAEPRPTPPVTVFNQAWRAGLFGLVDEAADSYKFSHQLLQEQFAAQALLTRRQAQQPVSELWRTARTPDEMPDPEVGEWDSLPEPPATGWEQTTILAAGMLPQADDFVADVVGVNPALAGRCLSEGSPIVGAETRAAVQQALLADLTNPDLHRRTRLYAGRRLAAVGDPRFTPLELNGVNVILPPLVYVPGGLATLGSADDEAHDNEQPVHQVEVGDFWLGQYPVTNAEYRCFIKAGGYDEEKYWTAEGWQWRQGQLETSGAVERLMEVYGALVDNPDLLDQLLAEGKWPKDNVEQWRGLIQLPAEQVRELAANQFGQRRTDQPYYWEDAAYNQANQPVVGVTWYEAAAYCAWLNDVIASAAKQSPVPDAETATALRPRGDMAEIWRDLQSAIQNKKAKIALPSEAEWEWAAGGPEHQRYPWGMEFDSDLANTLEGRVLGSSPVGAYPGGAAACGAGDMAGNVYEWTRSRFRDYPYQANDGREEAPVGTDVRMTLRGGAWSNLHTYARVSYRNVTIPTTSSMFSGFEL